MSRPTLALAPSQRQRLRRRAGAERERRARRVAVNRRRGAVRRCTARTSRRHGVARHSEAVIRARRGRIRRRPALDFDAAVIATGDPGDIEHERRPRARSAQLGRVVVLERIEQPVHREHVGRYGRLEPVASERRRRDGPDAGERHTRQERQRIGTEQFEH
jgi:hypothetical protein